MNQTIDWDEALNDLDHGNVAVAESRVTPAGWMPQIDRPEEMTSNDQQAMYVDIETVPDESRFDLFELPPLPELKPETGESDMMAPEEFVTQSLGEIQKSLLSKNPVDSWLERLAEVEQSQKKPRKGLTDAIEKLRKERLSVLNAAGDRQKKMATTPEMCRIVAIGWAIGSGETQSMTADQYSEEKILETFWELATDASPIIGFNIASFDLPAIFARSILTGTPATRIIDTSPFRRDVLDLMVSRFGRIAPKGSGLKQLAKMYGIQIPAGDVDGSQVAELMATDPAKVGEYVRSDVEITRQLHRLFSGYFCV